MNNHYVKLFSFFLSIVITVGLVPQVSGEEIFANTTSGSEQSVTVVCGKSQTLSSDSSGVTWSSSNPKIASVDANGKLTANKAGKTTVTARSSDKTDTYKIQVLYKDVTSTDDFWYEPVNWLTVRGVVKGYSDQTEFRPANECTRSQMLTFLWRLQGQPEPKSKTCRFPDVKETSYYFKPVIWAEEQGITTGYKDGTFKPKNNCTRAQAVTFMWRMAGKPAPKTTESKFPDVKDTDYFYKASLWASENKILEGMPDGTFDPQGKLLRRQMVTFLYRFDMYINHNLPTPTAKPASKPTATPTAKPSATPTAAPTAKPTAAPTVLPSATPSAVPTPSLSPTPSAKITISNAYKADTEKITVKLVYTGPDCQDQEKTLTDVDFDKTDGSCSFEITGLADSIIISSVTLLKDGVPFEWLDYDDPVKAYNSKELTLDVDDNEFANGRYVDANTAMHIANPRQLDNVRYHLNGSFKQVKDIDFGASCGISIDFNVDTLSTDISIKFKTTAADDSARFYGLSDKTASGGKKVTLLGWRAIGYGLDGDLSDADAFTGTYDGDGYKISNILSDQSSPAEDCGSALFARAEGAVFKNIFLDGSNIFIGQTNAAGIVSEISASADATVIDNCVVNATSYAYYGAGIVSATYDLSSDTCISLEITNCQVAGKVYGYIAGGVIAYTGNSNTKIKGCIVSKDAEIASPQNAGGIIGQAGNEYCANDKVTLNGCKMSGNIFVPSSSSGTLGYSGGLIALCRLRILPDKVNLILDKDTVITEDCTPHAEHADTNDYTIGYGGLIGEVRFNSNELLATKECVFDLMTQYAQDDISVFPEISTDREAHKVGNYLASPWLDSKPLPSVWILPEGYSLYEGKIINDDNNSQTDPSLIENSYIVSPGNTLNCILITSSLTPSGIVYKMIENTPAVAMESEDKDGFVTSVSAGSFTVTVSSNTLLGSDAEITCTVNGYKVRNTLSLSTSSMRTINIYLPAVCRPQMYNQDYYNAYHVVVPLDADNNPMKANMSRATMDEALINGFIYSINGHDYDGVDMFKYVVSVPVSAKRFFVLCELRAKDAAPSDYSFIMPAFMIDSEEDLSKQDSDYTTDDYVPFDDDQFQPLWTAEFATNQTRFGTYSDEARTTKTKKFQVGSQIYFTSVRYPGSEGITSSNPKWTIRVSDVRPLDTSVIGEDFIAKNEGTTFLVGNWYGVEGIIYPIHFEETGTRPRTYSSIPTPLTVYQQN